MTCTITRSPLIERAIPRETPLTQITFMLDTAEGEDFTGDLPPIALPDDHHDDEDRQCDYSYGSAKERRNTASPGLTATIWRLITSSSFAHATTCCTCIT